MLHIYKELNYTKFFKFRQIAQLTTETLSAFCNRVDTSGKMGTFCVTKSKGFAIGDQIVIVTRSETMREKNMLRN